MHEPECLHDFMTRNGEILCICEQLRAAYRRGYNDRAASAAHSYQMFGIPEFNQHGEGTNP